MPARSLLLLTLLPAALVAGCADQASLGLESAHQPVVARQNYALDLQTDADGLAPGEASRLAGWMSAMRLGYGDQIAVDDPARNLAAREAVAGEVARFGLLVSDDLPVSGAPVAAGTVRVVVNRLTASVPGCPDWSRNGSHEFEGRTSSGYGCAINGNLAAMVANPADLVRGAPGSGTADPNTASKAINTFRAAAPSGGGGTTVKAESSKGS